MNDLPARKIIDLSIEALSQGSSCKIPYWMLTPSPRPHK